MNILSWWNKIHQLEWVKTNGNVLDQLPKLEFVHEQLMNWEAIPLEVTILGFRNDTAEQSPVILAAKSIPFSCWATWKSHYRMAVRTLWARSIEHGSLGWNIPMGTMKSKELEILYHQHLVLSKGTNLEFVKHSTCTSLIFPLHFESLNFWNQWTMAGSLQPCSQSGQYGPFAHKIAVSKRACLTPLGSEHFFKTNFSVWNFWEIMNNIPFNRC